MHPRSQKLKSPYLLFFFLLFPLVSCLFSLFFVFLFFSFFLVVSLIPHCMEYRSIPMPSTPRLQAALRCQYLPPRLYTASTKDSGEASPTCLSRMANVEPRSLSPGGPASSRKMPHWGSRLPIAWAENRATAVDGGFSGPLSY